MEKLLIKRLVFLIVFAQIALGITYCLIINNTADVIEISESTAITEEEASHIKAVKLDETYDLNDLKITQYTTILENKNIVRNYEEIGEVYSNTEYTLETSDVEINYFQIDGLKDESIEIAINYSLKNDVETLVNEILSSENFESELTVSSEVCSSFANVISITYYVSYASGVEDYETDYICENFDLTTGNRLKLSDVIANTANMRQILSESLYNSVIASTSDLVIANEEWLELSIENYNDVEETILGVISNFKNDKDIDFSFNEYSISFLDFDSSKVLYKNCLDYVTIYDNFSGTDIFDGTYNNLKDLPTLTKIQYVDYQIIEEGDNYLIYVGLDSDFDDDILSGEKSDIAKWVDENVSAMKMLANDNPNTFYIFNYYYTAYDYSDGSNIIDVSEISYTFETSKSQYNNKIKSEILDVLRDYPEEELGEVYLYGGLFGAYLDYFEYGGWTEYEYNLTTSEIYEVSENEEDDELYTIWETVD